MRLGRHRLLPLIVCAFLLGGCTASRPLVTPPGSALPPPVPPPPSIPDDKLREIMEAYAARKKWSKKGAGGTVYIPETNNRHKGAFARRRALVHAVTNPAWISQSGFGNLFTQLDAEVAAVEAYLGTTPKAIIDGTDGPPAHLDLDDLAKVKTTSPNGRVRERKNVYLARRKRRIPAIVWGAAGIHANLWTPGTGAPSLRTNALNQVLDMRLRMVERINLQISSQRALLGDSDRVENKPMQTNNQPAGPWLDGFRVRMFEYPRIAAALESVVGPGNIAEWNGPLGQVMDWKWEDARHKRMHWNKSGDGDIRMPPTVDPDWTGKPAYGRFLRPAAAGSPAQAIGRLFTPSDDWWQRSWLFCDHVIAALQIEGACFALRRRNGNDTAFNALPARANPSYVMLTPSLGTDSLPDFGAMMNDIANDPCFEKLFLFEDDLQVGDHLIMWNNFLYGMISNGEWRLENALVTEVDSDPISGAFNRGKLAMQGHGTGERRYARYQDTIAAQAQDGMEHTQAAIKKAVLANAAVTEVDLQRGAKAVRWDPYEAFASPGAWWVRVPVPDSKWPTVADALVRLPKSVADQAPNTGAGYQPPPLGGLASAVFFPVFEPKMPSVGGKNPGWTAYFAARKNGPSASLPTKLIPMKIDGSMCPGLFFKGAGAAIQVIRPRVVP